MYLTYQDITSEDGVLLLTFPKETVGDKVAVITTEDATGIHISDVTITVCQKPGTLFNRYY